MNDYQTRTLAAISNIKKGQSSSAVPVGSIRRSPFSLKPLVRGDAQNAHIVRLLSRWRKKHAFWFPSQFSVTQKRTRDWLIKRVLDEPDRLLFMINIHGTYRGHIGLYRFDFAHKTCEIDNIVRGRSGVKGMMEAAIGVMMQWGVRELGIKQYTLQTTSDNTKAIALYTKLGFVETKRVALTYRKTEEGGEWIPLPTGEHGKIKRYDVYMATKNI